MMRSLMRLLAVAMVAAAGCGEREERLEPVPLDKLPAGSMEAAAKALPEVKFDRARKARFNGQDAFEIIGKDKRGKTPRRSRCRPRGRSWISSERTGGRRGRASSRTSSVGPLRDRLGHVDAEPAEGPEEVAGGEEDEGEGHVEAVAGEVAGVRSDG